MRLSIMPLEGLPRTVWYVRLPVNAQICPISVEDGNAIEKALICLFIERNCNREACEG